MSGQRWLVYKGSSFNLWTPDTGKYFGSAHNEKVIERLYQKRLNSKEIFSDFNLEYKLDRETLSCFAPRIALRATTTSVNSRTIIAALIPPSVVATHQASILVWPDGTSPVERSEAYLLGALSSMILDWYARRFIESYFSYPIFRSLPIPEVGFDPDCDDPTALRVIEISGRLAAVDDRFKDWADAVGVPVGSANDPEVKQDLIHELDACVAHLYGLDEDDLECLYDTFHHSPEDHADRKEAVLKHFRAKSWLK